MTDRYDRQRRLREVGAAGQARIAASDAVVAAGPHAALELSYLSRAGVERVTIVSSKGRVSFPHAEFFRFSGPRRVAVGASSALQHLLKALELG